MALFISALTVCVTARFDGNMQFGSERQKLLYSSHNLEDSASSFHSLCALCVSFHMLQMAGILPSKGVLSFPGYTPLIARCMLKLGWSLGMRLPKCKVNLYWVRSCVTWCIASYNCASFNCFLTLPYTPEL